MTEFYGFREWDSTSPVGSEAKILFNIPEAQDVTILCGGTESQQCLPRVPPRPHVGGECGPRRADDDLCVLGWLRSVPYRQG